MNDKKNKWVKVGRTLDDGAAAVENQPGPTVGDEDNVPTENVEDDNNTAAVPSKKRRRVSPE
jgi:hypothetical protein